MAKLNKKPLRNLRLTEYKGFTIIVQQLVTDHVFQYLIFKDGKIYHDWNQIIPKRGFKKKLTEDEVLRAGVVTLDMAYATCEAILAKDSPDKINSDNALGADVVNALENANKPMQKMVN